MSGGTSSGFSDDSTHLSQSNRGQGEVESFGEVYWSDELWLWRIGVGVFVSLLVLGAGTLLVGIGDMNPFLIPMGLIFVSAAIAVLIALRSDPRAASFSSALYGPYRLGESHAHEVWEVYDRTTDKPPRR